jgi:dihydrolipoamide dehydrogenase-binding protein of pyruvate dehydrogenase complex
MSFLRAFRHNPASSTGIRGFHGGLIQLGVTQLKMPALSPTMVEGKIAKWLFKEGDKIKAGDTLLEIETDKAVMGLEATDDGILAKILASPTSGQIKVNDIIALLVDEGDDWKNVQVPQTAKPTGTPTPASSSSQSTAAATAPSPKPASPAPSPAADVKFSNAPLAPSVSFLVHLHHLDPKQIPATGPKNRLLKSDVLQFLETSKSQPKSLPQPAQAQIQPQPSPQTLDASASTPTTSAPKPAAQKPSAVTSMTGKYSDIQISPERQQKALNYVESKRLNPHQYMTTYTSVKGVRKAQRLFLESNKIDIPLADFVIVALARSLRLIPQANALWKNEQVTPLPSVTISLERSSKEGKKSAILKNATSLGLADISKQLQLVPIALLPEGCIRVLDLSSTGIIEATEIIEPNTPAAVTISSTKIIPSSSQDNPEKIEFEEVIGITLSGDGRIFDAEISEKLLHSIDSFLADPYSLI